MSTESLQANDKGTQHRSGQSAATASGCLHATDSDVLHRTDEQEDPGVNESLSVLAHELRNPLACLRYAVAALRECGADQAAARAAQDVIEGQVRYMAQLVDDLSDVSRVTNGKLHLKRDPLDLAAVVREAVETNRPLIEGRDHRLTLRLPPGPLTVNADRMRLCQVLTNLLNNAAKYTPPGGRVELSAEREAGEAVLRVCDSGVGIPAETLPKIFDMFMQIDCSRDLSQGGLGIGLMLVRRLVELHGGSVQASSGGPNRGSEFVVRLPLNDC